VKEFVSSIIALEEHEKEEKTITETCFEVLNREYVFPEIESLVKRLPRTKSYNEKLMDLFNAMKDDRFYEFGDEDIYVKVNLHDFTICNEFTLYFQYCME